MYDVWLDDKLEEEPRLGNDPLDWLESVENGPEFDPGFDDPPAPI